MAINIEPALSPHLVVDDAAAAIDFYVKAFDAEELGRVPRPDGKLVHAALRINGFYGDAQRRFPGDVWRQVDDADVAGRNPGHHPSDRHDVDTKFQRALDAGATVVAELTDQFWGDRYGVVADPFGHHWSLGQPVREVSVRRDPGGDVRAEPLAKQPVHAAGAAAAAPARWPRPPSMSATSVNLLRGRPSSAAARNLGGVDGTPSRRVDGVGLASVHQLGQRRRLVHRVGQLAGVEVGDQGLNGLQRARLVGADEAGRPPLDPARDVRPAPGTDARHDHRRSGPQPPHSSKGRSRIGLPR